MTDQAEGTPLQATGERLVPDLQHGEVVHAEHLVRYLVAAELASDRRVLDAACGEGYGTALLAGAGARSATGVDLDEATIAHARSRSPGPGIRRGRRGRRSPSTTPPSTSSSASRRSSTFAIPERVLDELQRVLAGDGLLLVSTPNKHQYLVENEYHEREFFHEEFVELLRARFPSVELAAAAQLARVRRRLPVSAAGDRSGELDHELAFHKLTGVEPGQELYTLALCGRGELPQLRGAAVAAAVDEAHELARRAVEAERTAEMWHGEYKRAEDVYKESDVLCSGLQLGVVAPDRPAAEAHRVG